MKLLHLYIAAFSLVLLGCNPGDNELHGWSFRFIKIDQLQDGNYFGPRFQVSLGSDKDLFELYKAERGANIYMFCPLENTNFTPEAISDEQNQLRSHSFKDLVTYSWENGQFVYRFPVEFQSEGELYRMEKQEVDSLLRIRSSITCKMVIAFMQLPPRVNLTSEPFCISVDSILSLMD